MKILLAAMAEALVPLVVGVVLTTLFILKTKRGIFWLGPLLLLFAFLTIIRPLVHDPSTSMLYRSVYTKLLAYEDLLGNWHYEEKNEEFNKLMTYNFKINADGSCTMHFVSKDLSLNVVDLEETYEMTCSYNNGRLTHTPIDPEAKEVYENSYEVVKVTSNELLMADELGRLQRFISQS